MEGLVGREEGGKERGRGRGWWGGRLKGGGGRGERFVRYLFVSLKADVYIYTYKHISYFFLPSPSPSPSPSPTSWRQYTIVIPVIQTMVVAGVALSTTRASHATPWVYLGRLDFHGHCRGCSSRTCKHGLGAIEAAREVLDLKRAL